MEARLRHHLAALEHYDDRQCRCLRQMVRELLLAQSSDWAFILTMETSAWYAERRFRDHVHRFFHLEDELLGTSLEASHIESWGAPGRHIPRNWT